VAAKSMLGDLNPLGDGPCLDNGVRVPNFEYCPWRNLKASSLGSSLLCCLNQLEVQRWAMM